MHSLFVVTESFYLLIYFAFSYRIAFLPFAGFDIKSVLWFKKKKRKGYSNLFSKKRKRDNVVMCLYLYHPSTHQLKIINVGWRNKQCLSLALHQRKVSGHWRVAHGNCNIFFLKFVEATIVKLSGGKTKHVNRGTSHHSTLNCQVPVYFTFHLRTHLICRELHIFTLHT